MRLTWGNFRIARNVKGLLQISTQALGRKAPWVIPVSFSLYSLGGTLSHSLLPGSLSCGFVPSNLFSNVITEIFLNCEQEQAIALPTVSRIKSTLNDMVLYDSTLHGPPTSLFDLVLTNHCEGISKFWDFIQAIPLAWNSLCSESAKWTPIVLETLFTHVVGETSTHPSPSCWSPKDSHFCDGIISKCVCWILTVSFLEMAGSHLWLCLLSQVLALDVPWASSGVNAQGPSEGKCRDLTGVCHLSCHLAGLPGSW